MLIAERQNQILKIVNEKKYMSVDELVKFIYASPATIRRDLQALEDMGLIKRVRGGASAIEDISGEISSFIRRQTNPQEKRKIAQEASKFFKDHQSYFFDSSTTVSSLVPFLKKINDVAVVTNGIDTALLLNTSDNIRTFVAPGEVQFLTNTTVGCDAVEYINKIYCDICFFSCHGLSLHGPNEATIEQKNARKR
ncbi:MAG: DeoR/GlpR family DNA-binding transcription regulator [Bacilli bacterium]